LELLIRFFIALGVAVKSPQQSEDLKRIARPVRERPKKLIIEEVVLTTY